MRYTVCIVGVTILATTLATPSTHAQTTMTIKKDSDNEYEIAREFRPQYEQAHSVVGSAMPDSIHVLPDERVQLTGAEVMDIADGTMEVEVHGISFDINYIGMKMMSGPDTSASRVSVGDHVIINGEYDDGVINARVVTTPADRQRRIEQIQEKLQRLKKQLEEQTTESVAQKHDGFRTEEVYLDN